MLPVGVSKLASDFAEHVMPRELPYKYKYTWVLPQPSKIEPKQPSDKDGIDVIALGIIDETYCAWSMAASDVTYVVRRTEVSEILDEIRRGRQWFLIHSDLGNGKTVLKYQISQALTLMDYAVFWDTDFDLHRDQDIRQLCKENGKIAIFIDESPDRFDVIDGLLLLNNPNTLCFVCVRTTLYELGQAKYDEFLPDSYIPIDINRLDDDNVTHFIDLFNSLGLWGDRAALSRDAKESFIKVECDRRISRLILQIFEASEVGRKIIASAQPIVNKRDNISLLIILSFILNRIGHPPKMSLLSEVLNIDIWKITKSDAFSKAGEFLRFRDGLISSRSSIISQFLLRQAVSPETLIWAIEQFVRRLSSVKRNSVMHHLMTELLRFPVLESMIVSPRKREILIGYFQSVKDISFCQRSGLFWLNYAMARLSFGEFAEAGIYFKHAKALAKDSPKDLIDIDNHYARLLLESRTNSDDYADYFEAFEMAHGILIQQINKGTNKYFPFRQARRYVEFISFRKDKLSKAQVHKFITSCQQVRSAIGHLPSGIGRSSEVLECEKAMERAIAIASTV